MIHDDGKETIFEEVIALISNSWPTAVSASVGVLFHMICLIAVGRISEQELAGTGLGIMFCNVTGYSVITGIASGFETVASQLNGAGHQRLIGVALQRALFVASAAAALVILVWFFAELILSVFVDEELSIIAGEFIRTMCLALCLFLANDCVQRYLSAQGIFLPAMYSSLVALLLYAPLCWFLVVTLGMGACGGALAITMGEAGSLALLVSYIRWRGIHSYTWGGWSSDALCGTLEFMRVALPSCGMICLEWWCLEIVTLASAQLGTAAVAAQVVLFNTNCIAYRVGQGFAVAVGSRIGNLLGAGRSEVAARAAFLAWGTCVAVMLLLMAGLYMWRREWAGALPFLCLLVCA